MGAESHAELTRRCSNILGFLIVTNQLTPTIREAIWKPLIENKDSRTIVEIMNVIEESVVSGNMPTELCVDFCKRASAIPVSAFEPGTTGLIRKLVDACLQAREKTERGVSTLL